MNVASLFSGCGGMDLPFHQLGFKLVWANDIDKCACETYRINIGDHIKQADIYDIEDTDIPSVDLILGGFPCQDFSMIWKRGGIRVKQGNLYKRFVDIVSLKNPKMFVAENVKGILTANNKQAIKQIIDDFLIAGTHGYTVDCHLINFADYGVPQMREWVLIFGVRKDLQRAFSLPGATHKPENYMTAKQALSGVQGVALNNEHLNIHSETVEKLKLIPPGGNFSDIPESSPHAVKGMISHVYRRLHPDKPSATIIAAGGGGTWGYHYSEPRPLTNRERARLFGYPDDFFFHGGIPEVRKQIGNSVPPVGMMVFAKEIKSFLTCVNP